MFCLTETMARSFSRSGFVRLAGFGAAGLVAGPAATAAAATTRTIKVGLLVPTEGGYARMGESFAEGFRMYLEQAHVRAPGLTRPVTRGHAGAYTGTADLLASGVDVIVAGITAPVAQLVSPLLEERRIPMVVANVGGHVALPSERSPYILHNSLLYWQSCFALGRWAGAKLGQTAYLVSSQADSGYDTVFAFRRAFESAGGSLVGSAVTHEQPGDAGLANVFAEIRATRPRFVFANYSGPHAGEFRTAYAGAGLRTPLVGPAFLAEELTSPLGRRAAGVRTCASWTATGPGARNTAFLSAYAKRTGRVADAFAALGYDTAMLVVKAFRRGVPHGRLPEALQGVTIESPRGRLRVAPATNAVVGPLHLREVRLLAARGVLYANSVTERLPEVNAFPAPLAVLGQEQRSAYFNELLCA